MMGFRDERGIGYCGLACVLCSAEDCPGCKVSIAGDCDCSAGKCAAGRGIDGCYACPDYETCAENMPHGKRSRAFNRYAREFGIAALTGRLRVNFENGVVYHAPEGFQGDYDKLETEEEIYRLLRYGRDALDIHPLTPDLLGDYLDFFDNVAFADHPDWGQCYCMHFHFQSKWDAEPHRSNRDRVIEHINTGAIQGYLAYADGKVVGWCNANDKQNFAALKHNVKPELWEANEDKKVKSAVCFLVAPDMRGKGIATKLLERVCADAQTQGYDFIEGYPAGEGCDMYAAHHGTVRLFEKSGFVVHAAAGHSVVMRKYLENR